MAKRILHVDDSQVVLHMTSNELSRHGFEVSTELDPTQALDRIKENFIHVCILDIMMPNLNGIELLRQIKEFNPNIACLMLTGEVSQNTLIDTYRAGAECCYYKPLDSFEPLVRSLNLAFARVDHWDQLIQITHNSIWSYSI